MLNSRPRVTVLYHYFHPDDVVSARHYEGFCRGLAARNWDVEALPCNRGCRDEAKIYSSRESWEGIDIHRIWRPRLNQASKLGRILNAVWMIAAWQIYALTLGPEPPASVSGFVRDILTTGAGWAMIILGIGAGFLFACLSFAISVVSFPLMVDRDATLGAAIGTSLRAIAANPGPMALWGLIVACGLVLGSIPVLLGLIVVLPVLGHATWHLYRRLVP